MYSYLRDTTLDYIAHEFRTPAVNFRPDAQPFGFRASNIEFLLRFPRFSSKVVNFDNTKINGRRERHGLSKNF